MNELRKRYNGIWSAVQAVLVGIILMLLMLGDVFTDVQNTSLFYFFLRPATAVFLTLGMFLFYRFRDIKIEVWMILAYGLWFLITRIMHFGIHVSRAEMDWFVMMLFAAAICLSGLALGKKQRGIFLDVILSLASLFITVVAVFGIYTFLSRENIYLPGLELPFTSLYQGRLEVAGKNPNFLAYWFMLSEFISMYFFSKTKSRLLKTASAVIFVINYFGISTTMSRNTMIDYSVGIALIVIMLFLKRMKDSSKGRKAVMIILCAALIVPLVFGSFKAAGHVSNAINEMITGSSEEEPVVEEGTVLSGVEVFQDYRPVLKDTGRIGLYKSAAATLTKDPMRLLRGSLYQDMMVISEEYTLNYYGQVQDNSNFHNTLLNSLIHTGIAGFLIMLCFWILLLRRMVLVFFSDEAGDDVKILIAALGAMLLYNMLETSLLYSYDTRQMLFFVIAGAFLGYSYEILPGKKPETQNN